MATHQWRMCGIARRFGVYRDKLNIAISKIVNNPACKAPRGRQAMVTLLASTISRGIARRGGDIYNGA